MVKEDRPITFTISKVEKGYRMTTRDGRVQESNRSVEFNERQLFVMMEFASGVYNNMGYAVLFEID